MAVSKNSRSDHGGAWRPHVVPSGGACGGVLTGGQLGCTAFFNTVILTYYTHIFDEFGK